MDSFLPVSNKELQHLIFSMNNKSSLLDPAPVSLIKECSDIIFFILLSIVNKSFEEAEVPCHLKQATTTPTPIIQRAEYVSSGGRLVWRTRVSLVGKVFFSSVVVFFNFDASNFSMPLRCAESAGGVSPIIFDIK